jgi:Ca2+-binding EF-hand superfamily protein
LGGYVRAEGSGGDDLDDLEMTGKILFKVADENNDGQISQKEADDAANLMVGGFFFRADTNGDGVLSKEEAKQAGDAFLAQHPLLKVLVDKNRGVQPSAGNANASPTAMLDSFVDTNHDGNYQASEVRQAVATVVAAFYASADTNRDGFLSPTELNASIVGMANAAEQAAFTMADTDHNGQISVAEFDKAIIEPANAVFRAIDLNNDGQISQQEAQQARDAIMAQVRMLRVPTASNSPKTLLRTGQTPSQVSPIPNFGNPAAAPVATPR